MMCESRRASLFVAWEGWCWVEGLICLFSKQNSSMMLTLEKTCYIIYWYHRAVLLMQDEDLARQPEARKTNEPQVKMNTDAGRIYLPRGLIKSILHHH